MTVRWRGVVGAVRMELAVLALSGCAGAKYAVRADSARYPISFSPVLIDSDGQPAYLGEQLESCGDLKVETTQVSVFYGQTSGVLDLSSEVNDAVEAHGGVGLVSLAVTVENCASNFLFPLTLLPIWPGCQSVDVTGTVVRMKGQASDARASAEVLP